MNCAVLRCEDMYQALFSLCSQFCISVAVTAVRRVFVGVLGEPL